MFSARSGVFRNDSHAEMVLDHRRDPRPDRPVHLEAEIGMMIPLDATQGKGIAVMGLGRSGMATAQAKGLPPKVLP